MFMKDAAAAIVAAQYLNQFNKRSKLTILMEGVHGIGKSAVNALASSTANKNFYENLNISEFDDYASFDESIDLTTVKEGELPGYPFLDTDSNSEKYLRYAMHNTIYNVSNIQKYYYEKAKTAGFDLPNNRKLMIDDKGNEVVIEANGKTLLVSDNSELLSTKAGSINKYKLGETLNPEDRIYLMSSGQMPMYFILLDEANRAQLPVYAETMNFCLNRRISGYRLPFWCSVSIAQNPAGGDYATTDFDAAQLDRFVYLRIDSAIEEWADWAIKDGLDERYVQTVASLGIDMFSPASKKVEFNMTPTPSPRSHELACRVYQNIDLVSKLTGIFGEGKEEEKRKNDVLNILETGILGSDAWTTLKTQLSQGTNFVTIGEILTGESKEIAPSVVIKIKSQTPMAQEILSSSMLNWICNNWLRIFSWSKSQNDKEKTKFVCYEAQLNKLFELLYDDIKLKLINRLVLENMECIDENGNKVHKKLFIYLKGFTATAYTAYDDTKHAYKR